MAPLRYEENPARNNPLAGSIAATLRDRGLIAGAGLQRVGDLQAQGTLAGGAGTAGMVSAIGGAAASIPGALEHARDADQEHEARGLAIDDMKRRSEELKALDQGYAAMMQAGGDRSALYDSLAKSGKGHLVPQVTKSFDEFDKSHAEITKLREEADTKATTAFANIGATIRDGGYDPASLQLALSDAKAKYGTDPQRLRQIQTIEAKLQADPTVATVRSIVDPMISLDPERRKEAETTREHDLLHQDRQATASATAARDTETKRYHDEELKRRDSSIQIQRQRAEAAMLSAKNGGASTKEDATAIADAIESGIQPPVMTGLYRMTGPVKAELARRGFDLTKATLDFQATTKHLATLNGSQQTRIRQAASTAYDSLDVIDDLSKQWDDARIVKGGKIVPLNKAELALAKGGAYGQKAQDIATQLDGQITDVVSELGVVYMGGNSPTDHALGLAEKNLRADWSASTLQAMTKLARTNLRIRNNSIMNTPAITDTTLTTPAAEKPAAAVVTGGAGVGAIKRVPDGFAVDTPAGSFHFPTRDAAEKFRKAAGGQ